MNYRTISKICLAFTVAFSCCIRASELVKRSSLENKENEPNLEVDHESKRARLIIETDFELDTISENSSDASPVYVKPFDSEAIHVPMPRDALPGRGCLKGTLKKGGIKLHFTQEVIEATTYDITAPDAELRFFNAMLSNRMSVCYEMQQQGLFLSDSDTVFRGVNNVLRRKDQGASILIQFLMKHYFHVLSQDYKYGNVFTGVTAENANFIIIQFPNARSVHMQIFKEVLLRDPNLPIRTQLYQVKCQTAIAMIELAAISGRHDIIKAVIENANSLISLGENESVLFDAIDNLDLDQIGLIVKRSDGIYSVLFKNSDDKNSLDVALDIHEEGDDDEYQILLEIMNVIDGIRFHPDIALVSELFDEIFTKCNLIQDTSKDLLTVFGKHLTKLYESVTKYGPQTLKPLLSQNIIRVYERMNKE